MKEGFHIKPITKTEAMYLRDNGYEDYVQRAAICKSYYIVETIESLKFLKDYRKSVTVYIVISRKLSNTKIHMKGGVFNRQEKR